MKTPGYDAYIRSQQWAIKRTQYWATLRRKECQACGRNTKLHVHHVTYERFKNERMSDLLGLCEPCHALVHRYHGQKGGSLMEATRHVVGIIKATPKEITYIKSGHKPRTVKVQKKPASGVKRKTHGTIGERISTPARRRDTAR